MVDLATASLIASAASRFAALVPRPEPDLPFLRALLADADAKYLYRSASLWCEERGVASAEGLQRHAGEFREEFCRQLLGFTRERLELALGLAEPPPVGPKISQESGSLEIVSETPDLCRSELTSASDDEESSLVSQSISSPFSSKSFGVGVQPVRSSPRSTKQAPALAPLETVDTTGDGLVDTVGLDTTGDGHVDTMQKLIIRAPPQALTGLPAPSFPPLAGRP